MGELTDKVKREQRWTITPISNQNLNQVRPNCWWQNYPRWSSNTTKSWTSIGRTWKARNTKEGEPPGHSCLEKHLYCEVHLLTGLFPQSCPLEDVTKQPGKNRRDKSHCMMGISAFQVTWAPPTTATNEPDRRVTIRDYVDSSSK